MRRSRRFDVVALFVLLAMVAAACSSGDGAKRASSTSTSTKRPSSSSTVGSAAPAHTIGLAYDLAGRGDHSFNDAAAAGFERAKDLGLALKEGTPDQHGSNREAVLEKLVSDGSDLTFAVGFLFIDALTLVAERDPDARFAIIDGTVDAPNVASLTFAGNEGAFLVGAAAALTSKTGKVGFLGGVPIPVIKSLEAGFVAGAKYAKPGIDVDVRYLTQPPDTTGFGSPPLARLAALSQFGAGIDVVYQAARGSGGGVFVAAKEFSESHHTHVWAIGNDTDQYTTVGVPSLQGYILTSVVKKLDVAVYDTIERQHHGTDVGGTTTVYGLKAGGIDYATSGGFVDAIKAQLEDIRHKIVDGSIEVPGPS